MKYSNKNNDFRLKVFRSDSENLILIESVRDEFYQVLKMTPWQAKHIVGEVKRIEDND